MSQGPLCPNLSQKVQKEVSQMANRNLSCAMLYRWFKCKLKPPKNSNVISHYRTLFRAKLTTVCQSEFFLSPLRTQFCHKKSLRLPYHIFSQLSDFLIVVFFQAVFYYVARFKAYNVLNVFIKC